MEIRTTALPDHIQYCLDGATEIGGITLDVRMVLQLYAGDNRLASIIRSPQELEMAGERYSQTKRTVMEHQLIAYADKIMEDMEPRRRRAMLRMALPHLLQTTMQVPECLASWAFEDQRKGGAMLPFRQHVRMERDGRPTPRICRRLHSPSWIRRYVKHNDTARDHRAVADTFLDRLARMKGGEDADEVDQMKITDDLDRQFQAQRFSAVNRDAIKLTENDKHRKVVIRSTALASTIIGDNDVRAFVRGTPITIMGDEVGFELSRAGSLHGVGHGQLGVKVVDRLGIHLASLCIYVDKIPVLDQLAAIALHVHAGLEEEILAAGNITMTTEAGRQHPLFIERVKARDTIIPGPFDNESPWHKERRLQIEYFNETAPLWREAVGVFVLGHGFYRRSIGRMR